MTCYRCGLVDPYRGQGDGIGSCDCPRCQCCEAGPDECECARSFEDLGAEEIDELGDDYLCNDSGCATRAGRHSAQVLANRARTEWPEGGVTSP